MLHLIRLLLSILLLWGLAGTAAAAKRVALVIGNSKYVGATYLKNPVRDAHAIGGLFKRIGFDTVKIATDLSGKAMREVFIEFRAIAADSDFAVIYFAGHGIEVERTNYLLPTDAQDLSRDTLDLQAVSLAAALATISGARQLKLVLLDACRTNPFAPNLHPPGTTRSADRGLRAFEGKTRRTAVAYAAREGMTAADGDGEHSPFTGALLRHLSEPRDIRIVLGRVGDDVAQQTKEQQEPFLYTSLGGREIVLASSSGVPGLGPAMANAGVAASSPPVTSTAPVTNTAPITSAPPVASTPSPAAPSPVANAATVAALPVPGTAPAPRAVPNPPWAVMSAAHRDAVSKIAGDIGLAEPPSLDVRISSSAAARHAWPFVGIWRSASGKKPGSSYLLVITQVNDDGTLNGTFMDRPVAPGFGTPVARAVNFSATVTGNTLRFVDGARAYTLTRDPRNAAAVPRLRQVYQRRTSELALAAIWFPKRVDKKSTDQEEEDPQDDPYYDPGGPG